MSKKEYAIVDGQRVELTPWFEAEFKPVRVGVYKVDDQIFDHLQWYAYWNGSDWGYVTNAAEDAFLMRNEPTSAWELFEPKWRGLAHPQGAV